MLKGEPKETIASGFRVIKRAIQRRYMLEGEPKAPIAPGFNAMKRVIQRFGADVVSQQQRWFSVLRTDTVKVSGFPETTFLFSVRSKITESKKKKKTESTRRRDREQR